MPTHPTTRSRLRPWGGLILCGLVLNLIVSWALLLVPRISAAAELRAAQYRNPTIDAPIQSVFFTEHKWFGVHERQYTLDRRSRPQPIQRRIGIYWIWIPVDHKIDVIAESNRLFDLFSPQDPHSVVISNTRVGFPALSFETDTLVEDFSPNPRGYLPTQTRHGFIGNIDSAYNTSKPSVWPHAQHVLLPYRPIWSGFLFNSLIYTLIIVVCAWILRSIRHARRMHRGHCPFCTYELNHDFREGCPECGWRREPE